MWIHTDARMHAEGTRKKHPRTLLPTQWPCLAHGRESTDTDARFAPIQIACSPHRRKIERPRPRWFQRYNEIIVVSPLKWASSLGWDVGLTHVAMWSCASPSAVCTASGVEDGLPWKLKVDGWLAAGGRRAGSSIPAWCQNNNNKKNLIKVQEKKKCKKMLSNFFFKLLLLIVSQGVDLDKTCWNVNYLHLSRLLR